MKHFLDKPNSNQYRTHVLDTFPRVFFPVKSVWSVFSPVQRLLKPCIRPLCTKDSVHARALTKVVDNTNKSSVPERKTHGKTPKTLVLPTPSS